MDIESKELVDVGTGLVHKLEPEVIYCDCACKTTIQSSVAARTDR